MFVNFIKISINYLFEKLVKLVTYSALCKDFGNGLSSGILALLHSLREHPRGLVAVPSSKLLSELM